MKLISWTGWTKEDWMEAIKVLSEGLVAAVFLVAISFSLAFLA